jgi:hypothetical protein
VSEHLDFRAGDAYGHILSVSGPTASVMLSSSTGQQGYGIRATVGTFLGVNAGTSLLIGVVTRVSLERSSGIVHPPLTESFRWRMST